MPGLLRRQRKERRGKFLTSKAIPMLNLLRQGLGCPWSFQSCIPPIQSQTHVRRYPLPPMPVVHKWRDDDPAHTHRKKNMSSRYIDMYRAHPQWSELDSPTVERKSNWLRCSLRKTFNQSAGHFQLQSWVTALEDVFPHKARLKKS